MPAMKNQDEMKLIFDEESGQELYLVDNVYPKIDTLNVEPCRKVIQEAFEDNITKAPGMEHVRRHGKRSDHSDTGSGYGMYREAAV